MAERIEVLRRLQSLNNKVIELEKYKEQGRNDIQKRKTLLEDKRILSGQKQNGLTSMQKEIGTKELDLKTDEEKIGKFNVQLNQIKTNKEYTALRKEIGCKEADKSRLEDDILKLMSRIEGFDKEYKELIIELKGDGEKLEEFAKSVDEDVKKTDLEIVTVKTDLEKYSCLLDEDTLEIYKRLSNKKDGKVIMEVIDNACSGCYMSIRLQTLNLLMSGKELVICQNCQRILFLNEN